MAEIRVRDVDPAIIKQLEEIAKELGQATITGTLIKLFPRYNEMKKRIVEQNNEIGKLSQELRQAQFTISGAKSELEEIQYLIKGHLQETTRSLVQIKKQSDKFGTKKKTRAPGAGQPGRKNVPRKPKPSSKPKRKK